ncbi:DUF2938 domain-containing protein [Mesorhizobium sp. M00.F.Ca.ET.216.01.1.1]|uniref:DUF2938 domain-containing protein n=1 Tax=Mesorhizobium sp. M00.F.Ca.ET.216.01.1.1 TaxID=2500528 RepID=UPI000FD8E54B|nr:DUF2938 domain-containing protein [Mesorhizobium sp. M00.F.Ca.ET.216.01.1.1]TGQ35726.1 DUF2938 family protein [Mesorhizobium sp. M00.F.Ca.ET.216.01.1.1]TJW42697.1 MAG: DUF2938 family protein [Mesorhizobium sp.]
MFDILWRSVVIGIGATVLMDVWAIFLNAAFAQPRSNWGLVGRWVWHLRNKIFHEDIGEATPYAHETALGWAFHYLVGIVYGIILVALAGTAWLAAPTFLPAFILGMVTVGAGWFLLAPGMGAGWAASKRPNPMQIRALNLISHTVFALGLFGTALLIR